MKIIYHGDPDGFMSAFVLLVAFGEELRQDIELIPVQHTGTPPEINEGDVVIMLDFSYPKEVMQEIAAKSSVFVWVDHHASSASLVGNIGATYCAHKIGKAACRLTLEYSDAILRVCPKVPSKFSVMDKEVVAQVVDYIEEMDLNSYTLPDVRAITSYIRSVPMTFDDYRDLCLHFCIARDKLVFAGEALTRKYKEDRAVVRKSLTYDTTVDGLRIALTNIPPFVPSKVSSGLYHMDVDVAVDWCVLSDSRVLLSFRSKEVDVLEWAKKLGGGGHTLAAGATVDWELAENISSIKNLIRRVMR